MAESDLNKAKTQLVLDLFELGVVKFGNFTLKSGISSPIYFDVRSVVSHPSVLEVIADLMWNLVCKEKFDVMCGVPYTALPIATVMSIRNTKPMIMKRKEKKAYGTKKMIEGVFSKGNSCLIVEDLVTSGMSVFETVDPLREAGLIVKDVVVLLDREQGGKKNVENGGLNLHSVMNVTQILDILLRHSKITESKAAEVREFLANNQVEIKEKKAPQILSFTQRSEQATNPISQRLYTIMAKKETNLCASADLTTIAEVIDLAKKVGKHICMLKVHIDIIKFDSIKQLKDGLKELKSIAETENFMIFEDRKFADIGNTMFHQFTGGIYDISSWADVTNAHTIPGEKIITAFKKAESKCGLLLLAQMSSDGNLISEPYTKKTVEMAEKNSDCVMGFISQQKLSDDPNLIHMTPGVNLKAKGDALGQQYNTPDIVIGEKGSDIIIVGRGIYKADDKEKAAEQYKTEAWNAYQKRLKAT